MKKIKILVLLAVSTFAFADESQVVCQKNDSDKANWIFLEDAKKQVVAMGYEVKEAKMTKSGYCYEMLVIETSSGNTQEIYFDPTTLRKVKAVKPPAPIK